MYAFDYLAFRLNGSHPADGKLSRNVVFFGQWQVFEIFLQILIPFFQKSFPGSLDNTFLHKPCGFEQNRLNGIREILTTARVLAEYGLPAKTT